MKNNIASALKVVSYIVSGFGVIAFFVYASMYGPGFGFLVLGASGLSALIYYAIGEAISLLQDIKDNTAKEASSGLDVESLENISI